MTECTSAKTACSLTVHIRYPFDTVPPLDPKIEWAAFLGQVKQETGNLCFIEQWRCT